MNRSSVSGQLRKVESETEPSFSAAAVTVLSHSTRHAGRASQPQNVTLIKNIKSSMIALFPGVDPFGHLDASWPLSRAASAAVNIVQPWLRTGLEIRAMSYRWKVTFAARGAVSSIWLPVQIMRRRSIPFRD